MIDLDALEQKARAATQGEWLPESTEMYEDTEPTCIYRAGTAVRRGGGSGAA